MSWHNILSSMSIKCSIRIPLKIERQNPRLLQTRISASKTDKLLAKLADAAALSPKNLDLLRNFVIRLFSRLSNLKQTSFKLELFS